MYSYRSPVSSSRSKTDTEMAGQCALVRWCEDPPKWDVVNVKDIHKSKGIGAVAEVKYKGQLFPAVILEYGE